jgi:hypothetical protein
MEQEHEMLSYKNELREKNHRLFSMKSSSDEQLK